MPEWWHLHTQLWGDYTHLWDYTGCPSRAGSGCTSLAWAPFPFYEGGGDYTHLRDYTGCPSQAGSGCTSLAWAPFPLCEGGGDYTHHWDYTGCPSLAGSGCTSLARAPFPYFVGGGKNTHARAVAITHMRPQPEWRLRRATLRCAPRARQVTASECSAFSQASQRRTASHNAKVVLTQRAAANSDTRPEPSPQFLQTQRALVEN